MSSAINPEFAALREKVDAQSLEIAEMRGSLRQLDKIVGATTRQSVWQLIALVISLCGAIIAGLAYQTTMLEKRIEQLERSQNQRADAIEKRIEQSEKNLTARFDDLKQEVRNKRE